MAPFLLFCFFRTKRRSPPLLTMHPHPLLDTSKFWDSGDEMQQD